jgi:hypothetical protein
MTCCLTVRATSGTFASPLPDERMASPPACYQIIKLSAALITAMVLL